MVRMNSLADALRCINNAEKRGKRQVMLRWDSKLQKIPFFLLIIMFSGHVPKWSSVFSLSWWSTATLASLRCVSNNWWLITTLPSIRSSTIIALARSWSTWPEGWTNAASSHPGTLISYLLLLKLVNVSETVMDPFCRFDIAINDIEKWTNNLLPSRQFGKVGRRT